MPFLFESFKTIASTRGIENNELSKLLGVSEKRLREIADNQKSPTVNQIFKAAETLAVPGFAFFLAEFEVQDHEIGDFRFRDWRRFQPRFSTKKLQWTIEFRDFIAELVKRLDEDAPMELYASEPEENVEQFASSISKLLNINELRKLSKSKEDFFKRFRKAIEDLGVIVLQNHTSFEGIDGFSLYHPTFTSNLIYINSLGKNSGAKTFTLAHELSHIIGKRSAVTSNYKARNDVEVYCNKFAASLLMPRGEFIDFIEKKRLSFATYNQAVSAAKLISDNFKCSVSAALIRAHELGISREDHYPEFAKLAGAKNFPDSVKPDPIPMKDGAPAGSTELAYFGHRASSIMHQALTQGKTSEYEVFKKFGISKRRIEALHAYVEKKQLQQRT